jgi:hypothetical protein
MSRNGIYEPEEQPEDEMYQAVTSSQAAGVATIATPIAARCFPVEPSVVLTHAQIRRELPT